MTFTEPIAPEDALAKLRAKKVMPTSLTSDELAKLPVELRERGFFSARQMDADLVSGFKDSVDKILAGETAGPKEMKELHDLMDKLGTPTGDGGITDITSQSRMNLILKTNVQSAQGYGQWRQGNEDGALQAFPAQELVRFEDRKVPREWFGIWDDAVDQLGDATTATSAEDAGRMVAMKNDPIWYSISDFGVPWPPFKFNSGMGVIDVSYEEAVDLGVMDEKDDAIPPADDSLNADLSGSFGDDPSILAVVGGLLGKAFSWIKDRFIKNSNPNHDERGRFADGDDSAPELPDKFDFEGKHLTKRFRKGSATWVIYYRGKIVESGFGTPRDIDWHVHMYPHLIRQNISAIDAEDKTSNRAHALGDLLNSLADEPRDAAGKWTREGITAAAVKHFGTTNNVYEAGYILPDGRMLDLSGRHYASGYKDGKPVRGQPDYLAGSRAVDHRELGDIPLDSRGGTDRMNEFMRKTGAMRFHHMGDSISANVNGDPSAAQLSILKREGKTAMQIDYDIPNGETAHGEYLEKPTPARIDKFFRDAKVSAASRIAQLGERGETMPNTLRNSGHDVSGEARDRGKWTKGGADPGHEDIPFELATDQTGAGYPDELRSAVDRLTAAGDPNALQTITEAHAAYLRDNLQPLLHSAKVAGVRAALGGWTNPEDGKTYSNPNITVSLQADTPEAKQEAQDVMREITQSAHQSQGNLFEKTDDEHASNSALVIKLPQDFTDEDTNNLMGDLNKLKDSAGNSHLGGFTVFHDGDNRLMTIGDQFYTPPAGSDFEAELDKSTTGIDEALAKHHIAPDARYIQPFQIWTHDYAPQSSGAPVAGGVAPQADGEVGAEARRVALQQGLRRGFSHTLGSVQARLKRANTRRLIDRALNRSVTTELRDDSGRWTAGNPGLPGKRIRKARLRPKKAPGATTEPHYNPQLDSPEFKAWFDKSVVTNPDGTPQIQFHGTRSPTIFSSFRTERGENSTDPVGSMGAMFGGQKIAESFVTPGEKGYGVHRIQYDTSPALLAEREALRQKASEALHAMPTAMREVVGPMTYEEADNSIYKNNPIYKHFQAARHAYESVHADTPDRMIPVYLSIKNPKSFETRQEAGDFIDEDSVEDDGDEARGRAARTGKQKLIDAGYDGVKIKDDLGYGTTWIAFHPEQIKSALGNKGTFSKTDPDIRNRFLNSNPNHDEKGRFASTQTDSPAFRKWFGDSKMVDADGNPKRFYHGTRADFTKFRIGKTIGGMGRDRAWFSDSPDYSSAYSAGDFGAHLVPVYLSMKNPYVVEPDHDSMMKWVRETDSGLKDKGYDGVILKHFDSKTLTCYPFENTQIKSATGNRGTFDASDPDIRNRAHDVLDVLLKLAN